MNTTSSSCAAAAITPRDIITHAGNAHADEVVATALLLAADPAIQSITRVERVDTGDLENPSVYVLDIGRRHEAGLLNFDHHQFDADAPPRCTLSLVIDHLGLYPAARRCWPWLETFERWDTGGPAAVEQHFGITDLALILPHLPAPLEQALIEVFSTRNRLTPDDTFVQMLRTLGQTLLAELQQLPGLIDGYEQRIMACVRIPPGVQLAEGKPFDCPPEWIDEITLLKWPDVPRPLARKAFQRYLREKAPNARLTITPDERGPGFVLTSVSDTDPLDFRCLTGNPDITYIHATGFMAVTRTQDADVLERLLSLLKRP